MKNFLILLFLSSSLFCTAQNSYKYEKEDRIEKKLFPSNALELLEKTVPKKARKKKYYKEQDSIKISYELKLKYDGRNYSIEFDKNGTLEDVEVTIKSKEIPPKTLENIQKNLYNIFSSFRIKKIQRQYKNTPKTNPEKVLKDAFSDSKKSQYFYEIIAEVKTKEERYFIEITFSKNGDMQLIRTIILGSYDHILY